MALGPWITEADKQAVMAVLNEGDLMSGKRVALLEERLAAYFGKRHCVAVSSGTAALECAFVADARSRDADVVVQPQGFIALLSAIRGAGYYPVEAEAHGIGVATDVLGVDYKGNHRVHDCCHRFDKGAAHAEVSCFSFAPNKFIAACGGCLVTDDSVVAATARQYRNHGRDGGPQIFREGRNLRMPEINASLALSQLERIDEILARRKQVARWYFEIFSEKNPVMNKDIIDIMVNSRESWFLFAQVIPGHKHRSLADFRLFNTATQADKDTALLPIWPTMTREDVAAIVKELPCKS